jgi:heat shock protein HtpX
MRGPLQGAFGLRARTAAAAVLVCVANLAFVMLALELAAFFLELVIVELFIIPDWTSVGPHTFRFAVFLRETTFWQSPAVVPLTAVFMVAQYEYVSRRPVGTSGVERTSATDRDSQTRLTRLAKRKGDRSSAAATDLRARLTRLAKQVGVPTPDVVVADAPRPNSYTVGRKGNATVVVTRPLLDALGDDELDVVLAHELAHVANRDATVMTMAVAPVRLARRVGVTLDRAIYGTGAILFVIMMVGLVLVTLSVVALLVYEAAVTVYDTVVGVLPVVGSGAVVPAAIADPITTVAGDIAITGFDGIVNVGAVLLLLSLFAVPPLLAIAVYYVVLGPVPRVLARYREFAADRAAARITGDPAALASALRTLSPDARPGRDFHRVGAIGELCLLPGGVGNDPEVGPIRAWVAESLPRLERTLSAVPTGAIAHPKTSDRVKHLRAVAREQET